MVLGLIVLIIGALALNAKILLYIISMSKSFDMPIDSQDAKLLL